MTTARPSLGWVVSSYDLHETEQNSSLRSTYSPLQTRGATRKSRLSHITPIIVNLNKGSDPAKTQVRREPQLGG